METEVASVLAQCMRQVRCWHVPPNWSRSDWFEEMEAEVLAAAYEALHDYSSSEALPLTLFVKRHIMKRALHRYRREWVYARHCLQGDGSHLTEGIEGQISPDEAIFAEYRTLHEALAQLNETDHRLLAQLFWEGRKEEEIARELGVNQSTISRRKQRALNRLRRFLEENIL